MQTIHRTLFLWDNIAPCSAKIKEHIVMANHLPIEKKALVLILLTEGQSIRATSRIAEVSQPTILKLLVDAGNKARDIHDSLMVNIQSRFIQCDEQWQFIYAKKKNVRPEKDSERGDFYTFYCNGCRHEARALLSYWQANSKACNLFHDGAFDESNHALSTLN